MDQNEVIRLAGIVSLVDHEIVGGRVVDEIGLQHERGLRVVAMMMCVTRPLQPGHLAPYGYRMEPAGSAPMPQPDAVEVTPRFLVVPTADAQVARIAKLEADGLAAQLSAQKAEGLRQKAEEDAVKATAALARTKAELATMERDLAHAKKQAEDARLRVRRMEEDLGRFHKELGEKESRRILGDRA